MNQKNITAHLAVLGANVIFGLNYVIAKGIMPNWLEPRAIILLRVVGAASVFWLAGLFGKSQKVDRKDMQRMLVAAFFGVALNQIMFFEGLNLTTPINASIIMVGTPIFVLVMSHFVIGEKITRLKSLGITLGFLGAAFLILRKGHLSLTSGTSLGNLLVFVNASSYGLFLVLVKPLMRKYRPLTVMKWVFTFGLLFVLPVSWKQITMADFGAIPPRIWMAISYVIIFTTILAYFLNNYSLKRISPAANSSYIYSQPVIASLVAVAAGKDRITFNEIVSVLLIFAGVYFVNRYPRSSKGA
jgi:drug/metabolite transporter (DMT)-like permease